MKIKRVKLRFHYNSQQKELGHKLLNKLNQKDPAAQDLKLIKSASKPEQPGLSSSIPSEAMFIRTQNLIKSDSLNQPNLAQEI